MRSKIAIEVGTSYTKIYKKRVGVVLLEPTVIAFENGNYKKVVAVGYEAEKLLGKAPQNIKVVQPVNNIEIVDSKAFAILVGEFIKKIKVSGELNPSALLTVQCGSNREIISRFDAGLNKAGIYNICHAEAPVLALLGNGITITDTSCHAIVDIGGGQTTICVLNLNGVISGISAEIGGNTLTESIRKFAEVDLNFTLSNSEAEFLKQKVASLVFDDDTKIIIQGKETSSGKPRSSGVMASQIIKPVKEFADKVCEVCKLVLDKLSTDCLKEIMNNGIYLTGGASQIYGLSDYMSNNLHYRVHPVSECVLSTIIGAGKLIEDKSLLGKLKLKE